MSTLRMAFAAAVISALAAPSSSHAKSGPAKPAVEPEAISALQKMGEPVYLLDSNPTAERIAQLIFDKSREHGLPVSRVTVWETPTSWATYTA